jgi:hypothetical protein
MILTATTQTTQAGTVNGTLIFDAAATARDANGNRNLVLTAPAAGNTLTIGAAGTVLQRKGDRLRFDSTAARAVVSKANGGSWDVQGTTVDTTITALTIAADGIGGTCGNAASTGEKYTIAPKAGIGLAKIGERVRFLSGKLRNRHYEIVAVTATTFDICTHMDDTTSLAAGRQRLRRHRTIGVFPAYGTAAHHQVPEPGASNGTCTGAGAPFFCCSGAGRRFHPHHPGRDHRADRRDEWLEHHRPCDRAQSAADFPCGAYL